MKRAVLLRDVRMFVQRGRRGYSDEDLWCFDCYIARVLSRGLAQFAGTTHSWPSNVEWPKPEDWDTYLRDLSRRLGHWTDDNFADRDAFEVTRSAVEEFGKNFGHFWDLGKGIAMRSKIAAVGVVLLAAGCASSSPPLRHQISPAVVTPLQQAILKAEICLGEQPDIPGTADVGTPVTAGYLLAHPAAGTARWVECVQSAGPVKGLEECLAPALRRHGVTRQALPADVRELADCIVGAPQ